ncbi:MAG: hypothetical protein ACRD2O_15435, partial [Terriglobia bacterium]
VSESIALKEAAITAVLSSRTFAKSPNLARLFQYICQKYLEGSAPDLKEYNIGVDALACFIHERAARYEFKAFRAA